jgi:tRNA-binding protein
MTNLISWDDFDKIEMHIGTIIEATVFEGAKKPAYQLKIDFGDSIGVKKSSAQITKNYAKEDLIGKQVVAVLNFPSKQIANFMSECLILGSIGDENNIVLLSSDKPITNGLRVG